MIENVTGDEAETVDALEARKVHVPRWGYRFVTIEDAKPSLLGRPRVRMVGWRDLPYGFPSRMGNGKPRKSIATAVADGHRLLDEFEALVSPVRRADRAAGSSDGE